MKKRLFIVGAILLGLYTRRKNRRCAAGWTLFKATDVQTEMAHIDIEQQQATGIVTFQGKIRMTVMLDLKLGTVTVSGSVEDLGDLEINQEACVDMFKQQAQFFIEHQISDPQMHYASLLAEKKQAVGS